MISPDEEFFELDASQSVYSVDPRMARAMRPNLDVVELKDARVQRRMNAKERKMNKKRDPQMALEEPDSAATEMKRELESGMRFRDLDCGKDELNKSVGPKRNR